LVWGEPADQERIDKSLREDIPAALDYLEHELPADGFLFGDIGVADISIASFFRNAALGGFEIDRQRWPRTAAFVKRTLAHPALATFLPFEDVLTRVDPRNRRQALLDAGAPLTVDTLGTREPRRGIMQL
jgi:glutathione S-transferase